MTDRHDQPVEIQSDTGRFALIPEWVIALPISPGAFRLYALLARYADYDSGECWPSRSTLADRLNCSTDTIDRWVRELTEGEAITVHRRRTDNSNLTNLYRVLRVNPAATGRTNEATPTRKSAVTPSRTDEALTITKLEQEPVERDQVFRAWLKSTGRNVERTKLDRKRAQRIEWALSNYPLQDVLDAVEGWKNSPFHCGKNQNRKVYNDLTLLLRDSDHLETMRDLARTGKPSLGLAAWDTLAEILEVDG